MDKTSVKSLVAGLFVLALIVAAYLVLSRRSETIRPQVRADVVDSCEGRQDCLDAVARHFDACFDESIGVLGLLRPDESLANLRGCLNRRAGSRLF